MSKPFGHHHGPLGFQHIPNGIKNPMRHLFWFFFLYLLFIFLSVRLHGRVWIFFLYLLFIFGFVNLRIQIFFMCWFLCFWFFWFNMFGKKTYFVCFVCIVSTWQKIVQVFKNLPSKSSNARGHVQKEARALLASTNFLECQVFSKVQTRPIADFHTQQPTHHKGVWFLCL